MTGGTAFESGHYPLPTTRLSNLSKVTCKPTDLSKLSHTTARLPPNNRLLCSQESRGPVQSQAKLQRSGCERRLPRSRCCIGWTDIGDELLTFAGGVGGFV